MSRERRDEIDELFGRLEPIEPPADLTRQVFRRTTRAPVPAWRSRPELVWGLADLVALVALAALSVSLGWTLAESGGIDLLRLVLDNLEVAIEARADLLPALAEALPWLHLVALAADLVVVWLVSRMLVGSLGAGGDGRREAGRR